jgi:hypothetical protein
MILARYRYPIIHELASTKVIQKAFIHLRENFSYQRFSKFWILLHEISF